jgi:hypothetical protein
MLLLNKNERELVKLATFFIKNTERLIQEGKLGEENQTVISTCHTLIEKINLHAENRESVKKNRENLKNLIKDNAHCPRCNQNSHLKLIGVDNEEKWECNRYKCRRCNITFTWNRPNNPWDMLPFTEALIQELVSKIESQNPPEDVREQTLASIEQMRGNISKIKEIVAASDEEFETMKEREIEMSKLVHEFKNYLLIEKIKMDTWKNPFEENK